VLTALQQLSGSAGNPATDPAAFLQISSMGDQSNIASQFPSWQGQANPSGNFANELGNRLMFPLVVIGNGQKISLSQVDYSMSSDEPAANAQFGFSGSFQNFNYVAPGAPNSLIAAVGVINGPNGPTYVSSGSGNQLVDELLITGIGTALAATDNTPGVTDQDKLDAVQAQYDALMPFCLTAAYSLFDNSNGNLIQSSNQNVAFGNDPDCVPTPVPVPEPGGLALLTFAAIGGALGLRRRSRHYHVPSRPTHPAHPGPAGHERIPNQGSPTR
jgi:hypothetical protein